ncbi:MAG: DsbE family thiol:disulfide interchange protein [Gammaproteobacteria bacterium]|nr:MAG: DsbE family thiol:disulfide interchange protein [Gammaproteobacteria bacterium]
MDKTENMSNKIKPNRYLKLSLPLLIFLVIAVLLGVGLSLDPRLVPSPLIGKSVPEFNLAPVKGRKLGLATGDLINGEVSLVNVFASWCTACLEEHPLLMRLAASGTVPIHGLNYKDKPDDASQWLDRLGDPYTRTGADINGRAGIDWGVYGVPETFVIDREGKIAYKHIGPVSQKDLDNTILPLVLKLQRQIANDKQLMSR